MCGELCVYQRVRVLIQCLLDEFWRENQLQCSESHVREILFPALLCFHDAREHPKVHNSDIGGRKLGHALDKGMQVAESDALEPYRYV